MFGTAETLKTFLFLTDKEIENLGSKTLEGRVVHMVGEHRTPGMISLEVDGRRAGVSSHIEDDTTVVWTITRDAYDILKTSGKYFSDRLELAKTY